MNTYDKNQDIQEIPLSSPFFREQVKRFLEANGLRMESLDAYYAIRDNADAIIAGAGMAGDIIKCLAVAEEYRSEGLLVPLISRILATRQGRRSLVYTKPEYQAVFESLGFHLLASAQHAILLENGHGLEQYCDYLRAQALPGRCGVVVMNANPFTKGHQYLLEQAAAQVDHLYVIPVKEDLSEFPYAERRAMILAGAPAGVHVLEGSDYVISSATFPTYFLKDLSQAAETQMQLDLDLYNRRIAPALGASVRFVGSEPFDALTNRYNTLIPNAVIIPRYASAGPVSDGMPTHAEAVSASRVRQLLTAGDFRSASALCPATTEPYLLAALAERALRLELDTPGKPGLVGPDGPGAHKDMDYDTMLQGIRALRPYWSRMVLAASADELRSLGIEAEKAMMAATGGVNTHRGAIFCLGLALNAAGRDVDVVDNQSDMQILLCKIAGEIFDIQLKDSSLQITPEPRGARRIALEGYKPLFEDWLPYYSAEGPICFSVAKKKTDAPENQTGPSAELKTLLRIMSTLDDTCVIKRVGEERAAKVKEEILRFAQNDNSCHPEEPEAPKDLKALCTQYAAEGISPGGAADMLALTIFIYSIL